MERRSKYPTLQPGDIAGVEGQGVLPWLAKRLFTPHTDLYHWFIIDYYILDEDDYVIYESIAKGVTVGRLSFYKPEELGIFRRDGASLSDGKRAVAAVTTLGRAFYDYWLYVKLFADVIRLVLSGNMPPWKAKELRYSANSWYVCTEAAVYGWEAIGAPIIPVDVMPMGSGFIEAALQGIIKQVYP